MIRGLPYDAELEYLESTGTQYINTGIKLTSDDIVDITASRTNTNSFFGSTQTNKWFNVTVSSSTTIFRFGADSKRAPRPADGQVSSMSCGRKWIVDGTEIGTETSGDFASSYNCGIFARIGSAAGDYLSGRVYKFSITRNGTLILDLIPVRVGSGASAVGYMYDRVSKRLFGNAGSGAFVLGPDKAVPILSLHRYASPSNGVAFGKMGCTDLFHRITAKDYVQSGLVAMWDGIENAGWGTHSDSPATWKDLTGNGYDLILNSGVNIGDDNISADGIWLAYYGSQIAFMSMSVCLKLRDFPPGVSGTSSRVGDSLPSGKSNYVYMDFNPSTMKMGLSQRDASGGVYAGIDIPAGLLGARATIHANYEDGSTTFGVASANLNENDMEIKHGTSYPYNNAGTNFAIGGRIAGTTTPSAFPVGADVCRIALYSRALTADEIARNYAIDKARFNLP